MANDILEQLKSSILDLDMDTTIEKVNSIINGENTITIQEAVGAITETASRFISFTYGPSNAIIALKYHPDGFGEEGVG